MESYQTRLITICDEFIDLYGWDMDDEEKTRKETGRIRITNDHEIKKKVYKVKSAAAYDYGVGIVTLYNAIPTTSGYSCGFSDTIRLTDYSDYDESNRIWLSRLVDNIASLISLYEEWESGEYSEKMSGLAGNDYFDDKSYRLPANQIETIEKLATNSFTISRYTDGGDTINTDDTFCVSPLFGVSNDLIGWLDYLVNTESYRDNKDMVYVSLFGKLDNVHPVYSSWLITIQKGGTTWIATDAGSYDNSGQKSARLARRSVWRQAAELRNECDLPYEIFDNIDSARAGQNELMDISNTETYQVDDWFRKSPDISDSTSAAYFSQEQFEQFLNKKDIKFHSTSINYYDTFHCSISAYYGGDVVAIYDHKSSTVVRYHQPEMLKLSFKELTDPQKMFFVTLVGGLMNKMSIPGTEYDTVELSKHTYEKRLIGGHIINPLDNEELASLWHDRHEEVLTELVETLHDVTGVDTMALVPMEYNTVFKSSSYSSSDLGTPAANQASQVWSVLNDRANHIIRQLHYHIKPLREVHTKRLYHMMFMESKRILELGTSSYKTTNFTLNDKIDAGNIEPFEVKSRVYGKLGTGPGKETTHEEWCVFCNNRAAKVVMQITIKHYALLLHMLNCDRKDLPAYYRQYRAHWNVPGTPNHLLNMTHPYSMINDPASRRSPNGLKFRGYMCGVCYNNRTKKLPERGTINLITDNLT